MNKLCKTILDCSHRHRFTKGTYFLSKYLSNEPVAFSEEVSCLFCLCLVTSGLEGTLNLYNKEINILYHTLLNAKAEVPSVNPHNNNAM